MKQIGLFGGSFDPPHLGHVALLQAGLAMGLDEVWLIPALPVHKELSGKADGATRLSWLQKVFEDHPRVKVLDWEISQSIPTAAVHSLRRFKTTHPDIVPWLMLGADAWNGLPTWREYPVHQTLCNVIVFARQGDKYTPPLPHAGWQHVASDAWQAHITAGHWCDVSVALPDISATQIRENAALGLSLSDLVPKVLQSEIEKKYARAE